MGDSDLTASELRERYHRGGTATDDELSAAQLRARHGVASNRADFSTNSQDKQDYGGVVLIVGVVVVTVVGAIVYYNSF